jgi:hypothetical protein
MWSDTMIYQFKPGSHLYGEAQPVGERLAQLEANGRLTPADVLGDARSEQSPLHPHFEWDDSTAAQKYRLAQAGHLIRCVTVVVDEVPNEEPRIIRAFVPISDERDEERRYVQTVRALADPELRHQVLRQAYAELGAVARKYRELKELSDVVQAIDRVGELLTDGQPA